MSKCDPFLEESIYLNKTEKSVGPIGCAIDDKSYRFVAILNLPHTLAIKM